MLGAQVVIESFATKGFSWEVEYSNVSSRDFSVDGGVGIKVLTAAWDTLF